MSISESRAVVERFIAEVWNAGDLGAINDLVHPDYAVEGTERGSDFVRNNVAAYRTAFPDLECTIEQVITEADWVAARLTLRGTHLGPLGDIPPSGNRVEMREMAFWQVAGGRVRAIWSVGDALSVRVQIGALPASAWYRSLREAEGPR
jgi:steroid delta-isomerase-like uncharacterized protein